MNTFGVDTAGQGFEPGGRQVRPLPRQPADQGALQWLNKLWNDGLIDPEALSQKNETLREKMMNRRIALMADWAWPYWATVTAGKTAVTETVLLPYPTVPGVAKSGVNVTYNPNGGGGILITKNAKNPDAIARLRERGLEGLRSPDDRRRQVGAPADAPARQPRHHVGLGPEGPQAVLRVPGRHARRGRQLQQDAERRLRPEPAHRPGQRLQLLHRQPDRSPWTGSSRCTSSTTTSRTSPPRGRTTP